MGDIEHVTPSKEELSRSIQTNIPCPVTGCGKILPQESALNFHLAKTHKIVKNEAAQKLVDTKEKIAKDGRKYKYHCPWEGCSYFTNNRHFASKKCLKQHYMKVHGEKKFECTACGLKFSLDRERRRHELYCGETNCTCGLELSNKESLLVHCKKYGHKIPARFLSENKKPSNPTAATAVTSQPHRPPAKSRPVPIDVTPRQLLPKPSLIIIPTGSDTKAVSLSSKQPRLPIIMIADCRPTTNLKRVSSRSKPLEPKIVKESKNAECPMIIDPSDVRRDQDTQTDILSFLMSGRAQPHMPACNRGESSTTSTQTNTASDRRTAAQTQTPGDMILRTAMKSANIPVKKQSTGCQVSPRGKNKRRCHTEVQTQTGPSPVKKRKKKTSRAQMRDGSAQAAVSTSTISSGTDMMDWGPVGVHNTASTSTSTAGPQTDPQSIWNPLTDNETQTMALLAELDATLAESISTQTLESYLSDSFNMGTQGSAAPCNASIGAMHDSNFVGVAPCNTQSSSTGHSKTVNQESLTDLGFTSSLDTITNSASNSTGSVNTDSSMFAGPAVSRVNISTQSTSTSTSTSTGPVQHQESSTDPLFGGDYFSIGINTHADDFLQDSRAASHVETQTTRGELSIPEFFTSASQTTDFGASSQTNTETQTMDDVFQQLFTNMETQTQGQDSFMADFTFADIETQTNISLGTSYGDQPSLSSSETQFSLADIDTQTHSAAVQAELFLNTVQTQTASAFASSSVSPGRQTNSETQTLLANFEELNPGLQDSHTQTTWNELESLMKDLE